MIETTVFDPSKTLKDFTNLCREPETLGQIPNEAILCIGFGVDEFTPLRVVSYPLLAFEILKEKPQTTLEMYTATEFNQLLYGTDPEVSRLSALRLQKTVINFCLLFYPEIANRVSFVPTNPLTEPRLELLENFIEVIKTNAELVNFSFAPGKNGLDSLRYLAAHALYMRDLLAIDPSLFLVNLPQGSRPVVMIGGDAETKTWLARQEIFNRFGKENANPPTQIFTALGRTPPYFRKAGEPIVGEAVTTNFLLETEPEIYRDYAAILITISQALGDASSSFNEISAKKNARQSFVFRSSTQVALAFLNDFSQENNI